MKRYIVCVRYSMDGKGWNGSTLTINAESDLSAMEQAKSRFSQYNYFQITSINAI